MKKFTVLEAEVASKPEIVDESLDASGQGGAAVTPPSCSSTCQYTQVKSGVLYID